MTRTTTGNASGAETVLNKTDYWHKDHIGSLVATTDPSGAVTQRFRFEPWRARECLNVSTAGIIACSSNGSNGSEERGFTGHEMLDEIGLVHMNGRLYDPEIGRFLRDLRSIERLFKTVASVAAASSRCSRLRPRWFAARTDRSLLALTQSFRSRLTGTTTTVMPMYRTIR